MTVPVPGSLTFAYDADGVTTVFPYPIRFMEPEELAAIHEKADGEKIALGYNVDYTVTGAGDANGGYITTLFVASEGKIILTRDTAAKQLVDLRDGARNPAEAVEQQLDRMTMVDQDHGGRLSIIETQTGAIDEAVRRADLARVDAETAEGAAEAAQRAAEAAQIAAEAAAAGVDLPPVTPNSMLVDNADGSARESRTFGQVHDLLDPLKDFAADGVTDDTANFSGLRSRYPTTEFDLKGEIYSVSEIPTGPFRNGYFKVVGGGEGGGSILYPARETLKGDSSYVFTGNRQFNWPQDACHEYNGVLYAVIKEGDDHIAADNHVRLIRSFDNGQTWEYGERLFQAATGARYVFGACIVAGRQCLIVREHTGDGSDAAITGATLYTRRIGERREKKLTPIGDFRNMVLVATSGSSTIRLANCPRHGCRGGDKIKITNVGETVGGLSISGEYTVAGRGADWVEFAASANATSTQTVTTDFVVEFLEGNFGALNVSGTSIYSALKSFSPIYASASPFYFYTMVPDHDNAAFWVSVTGGGVAPHIVRVDNLWYATPAIASAVALPTDRAEVSIDRRDDGTFIGFGRTNSLTSYPALLYSTNNGVTWASRLNGSPANDFRYSPISCRFSTDGQWIHAVATGNRVRGEPQTQIAGEVPLYWLRGKVSDVLVNGWQAMEIVRIGSVFFANASYGDTGNGVGVPSIVYHRDTVHLFAATERQDNVAKPNGTPAIVNIRIFQTSAGAAVQELFSPRTDTRISGQVGRHEAGRYFGWGAAHLFGAVFADGSKSWGHGFTCTKTGTGMYTITFEKPVPTSQYHVDFCAIASGLAKINTTNRTATGFTLETRGASDNLGDAGFSFCVFVNYQFTRTDWQADL